ncbi:uncharacterized protein LOC129566855 [Sitodiplosis mosellana]|uniref:uncharacterized protein LOC129566855 n=1 Tax=Sitodiplosis mosellana TaxID=263140 RepID=UPI0024444CF4|nr:uncharacterized protein LOC129566855 [Sitodiplosis mosellana]
MSKLFQQLIMLSCAVYMASASLAIALPNSRFPSKCYDGEKTYDVGVHYPGNKCESIICQEDLSLLFRTCGSEAAPDGYEIVQDLSRKYPECCSKLTVKKKKSEQK